MKPTGIVRRIDDLGRIVIPKEIRRTCHVREGDPMGIYLGEDGEIMPLAVGGGSTMYFCDYFYTSIPSSGEAERGVLFGGTAHYGAYAGFVFANTSYTPANAVAFIGSRLCFIPETA